jgi:hypothetical protein
MGVGRTPEERFLEIIQKYEARISALESAPLQIPMVNADPTTDYKGNIWMFADGRLHVRLPSGTIKEFTSVATSGAASATSQPTVPAQPVTTTFEWAATWSQAYRQSGGFTGGTATYLYYGNSHEDTFNGTQTSLIGFNASAIAAVLAGATINKVEIYLDNIHTYPSGGTTVDFGKHNNSSAPASYGSTVIVAQHVSSGHVTRNQRSESQGAYHQVATSFGADIRDGLIKGIILQAPTSSQSYYGYAAGVGSGLPVPAIRITYTK